MWVAKSMPAVPDWVVNADAGQAVCVLRPFHRATTSLENNPDHAR